MKNYIVLEDKPWYKSKTIAAAVVIAAYAIYQAVTQQEIDMQIVASLAGAFGLVGLRQAISKI